MRKPRGAGRAGLGARAARRGRTGARGTRSLVGHEAGRAGRAGRRGVRRCDMTAWRYDTAGWAATTRPLRTLGCAVGPAGCALGVPSLFLDLVLFLSHFLGTVHEHCSSQKNLNKIK